MIPRATTPISYRPDISIRAQDGETIALVEVKNAKVLSHDAALELYHDVIAESTAAQAPYFLLLSQRLGFLWGQRGTRRDRDAVPLAEFAMRGVVARYLPDLAEGDWLRGQELTFILSQWLFSLATGQQTPTDEPEKTLAGIGFLAVIEGAIVALEPSVGIPAAKQVALAV